MMRHRPFTGRMALIWVLAFFGVVFAANGALVFFALDSWPGLMTDKAYEEGVAYNQTLDAQAAQARLGWSSTVAFESRGPGTGFLEIRLKDRDNTPVSGVAVRAHFRRPVREGFDVSVILNEIAPGHYGAPVTVSLAGRWYATIKARRKDETVYRMRHEVMVTP
ncbi:MAG: FixH family protein [Alphaproteobacteria bacterium]|jgi:nitrogen fixation protein FixH|nr:FixH family protein [Alphaproteobacteria bacterium]